MRMRRQHRTKVQDRAVLDTNKVCLFPMLVWSAFAAYDMISKTGKDRSFRDALGAQDMNARSAQRKIRLHPKYLELSRSPTRNGSTLVTHTHPEHSKSIK